MRESRYNVWAEANDQAYVFNGVSGALLRLSLADYRAIRGHLAGDPGASPRPAALARLVEGMMLTPDQGDEIGLLRDRYRASRHQQSGFGLTIVTSLGCNFDCPYCFEAKHASVMDDDVQAGIGALLRQQIACGITSFHVTWFGGEPLIGKRALLALSDDFIAQCDAACVSYDASMTSNGYLLDEDTCADLRDRRVRSVQVCLDGPPRVHDAMRPLTGGRETFWRIVRNLHHAVRYMGVSVRVNLDSRNAETAEELLAILASEGLAGKISVQPAQIVAIDDGVPSPSAKYRPRCLSNPEFARLELDFHALARHYGFGSAGLPMPTGAPCTAVRVNELVVGSEGELYKCWNSVGNPKEVIGHISQPGFPKSGWQNGSATIRSPTPSAGTASPCRFAWAAARTTPWTLASAPIAAARFVAPTGNRCRLTSLRMTASAARASSFCPHRPRALAEIAGPPRRRIG